ncbi:uncharacterized protein B0T23DRAFT_103213 [Neurospora hispaniola]|uniref:AAA+ ATPase domain-containing protein n=1 Tax=Neurospora hispaniola TaxID=588809 RepID=A0AAJ0I8Z5_9PEZI|nr:hypothetical protein B0T23DRAFT_103213 [Neurospora hispaniola]
MSLSDYSAKVPHHFKTNTNNAPSSGSGHAGSNQTTGHGSQPTEQGQAAKKGPSKGFVDIVEYHTAGLGGRVVNLYPTSRFIPRQSLKKKTNYQVEDHAVILRRTWVERNGVSIPVSFDLEIHSEPLCVAFRKIATQTYESADLKAFPIKISTPFMELFFYRDEIRNLSEDKNIDEDLRRDAKALSQFVHDPESVMASILQDHDRYSPKKQVVNDILWTIYRPNSLLVLNQGSIQECWICRNITEKITKTKLTFWEITGLRIDFDGSSPGLTKQRLYLPLTGMHPVKISGLALVPAESYPQWESLKSTLQARSQKLQRILGSSFSSFACQSYSGAAWKERPNRFVDMEGCNPTIHDKQIDERVMVDFKTYGDEHSLPTLEKLEHNNEKPNKGRDARPAARNWMPAKRNLSPKAKRRGNNNNSGSDSDSDADRTLKYSRHIMALTGLGTSKPQTTETTERETDIEPDLETLEGIAEAVRRIHHVPEDELMLTFPALVPAFGLKGKKWWWVLSDQVQNVVWNMAAFESLQQDKMTKKLVQALVKGHKSNPQVIFDDVIAGKGQGLVFLLHGKPGLGKTLTAESVADYLERPLYSISGGELGTEVSAVEEQLEKIFNWAKRWNAVTLLDEADVLLCKRSSAEMDRNAIVAVFLRMLEYFQGVLFLTTNRKQDFDDAFKSRIHVTISYPELSPEAKSRIWQSLINTNKSVEVDESWTKDIYNALGQLNLNVNGSPSFVMSLESQPRSKCITIYQYWSTDYREHAKQGRTIKNILRTAVAYANSEGKKLGARHVLAILRTELRNGYEDSKDEEDELSDEVSPALRELHTILGVSF